MTWSSWDIIGVIGIGCIEVSYLTQIFRLHQRQESSDISVLFPLLNLLGRLLAMGAAFGLGTSVFVVGFLVGALLRATFLGQVIWYRKPPVHSPPSASLTSVFQTTEETHR